MGEDFSILWLIAAAAFFALEAFGVPGVGFIFAAIGAMVVGLALQFTIISDDAYVAQFAVFFLTTSFFAVLLWRKLKNWRLNPSAPRYHNIVGTDAIVTQPLTGDHDGEVRWSGTLMRARLANKNDADIPVGTAVVVREADGNLLKVARKE